jgi:hypothetical protein
MSFHVTHTAVGQKRVGCTGEQECFPVSSGANHGITGKWVFSIDRLGRASLETFIRNIEVAISGRPHPHRGCRPPLPPPCAPKPPARAGQIEFETPRHRMSRNSRRAGATRVARRGEECPVSAAQAPTLPPPRRREGWLAHAWSTIH